MAKLLYDNLTTAQRDFFLKYLWNGVGSDNLPKPPSFIFSDASKYHDFSSFSGGTEADRQAGSHEFFWKCHDAVRLQPMWKRPFYYLMSYIYYFILIRVDSFSWSYFEAPAQNWAEFIDHVKQFYIERNKDIPDWLTTAETIQ